MDQRPGLSIVIPAYNEADNLKIMLPSLIEYCGAKNWNIIVVNDGSGDNTREVLETFNNPDRFMVVHHKLNKGYGAAIKSGILVSKADYVITIDGDGQHRFEDIEKLFTRLKASDADMVVGSRKGTRSASIYRGIGKRIIRLIARILMTVPIHDINSGMKIYRIDLAKKYLSLTPDTMAYSDIITLVFINNRHLVLEEPITV
ncbi:MAG: glycosyltransferase family 2 protein, partial [Ferruginibacter sp.]|nr:glycosyltransferase family 2 protein [Chitinophagaceae bacterium]